MPISKSTEFQIMGKNKKALFTLKVHRGDGMLLLAMNWKKGEPPKDFVGFAIEYKEPGGNKFFALNNRLSFVDKNGNVERKWTSSLQAPFQKFRWIHFPQNADLEGDFIYKVKPVFMDERDELSLGEPQEISIQLARETYKNKLNVTFTRGYISSQKFVDDYADGGGIRALLPENSDQGLSFKPTHPKRKEALAWMGFEAVNAVIELLDQAIADKDAEVKVVAFDLNVPEIVDRLVKLRDRVQVIIDNSKDHVGGSEDEAEQRLMVSTNGNVKRQKMGQLQHNKTIVVNGPKVKAAVCGSTNFSWRGFYVQANNAVIVKGAKAIKPFLKAFENYWGMGPKAFASADSGEWQDLSLTGVDAKICFSPHSDQTSKLAEIADDMMLAESSIFYSLAFLSITGGPVRNAVTQLTDNSELFIYGIANKRVGGFEVQKPDGSIVPVYPAELSKNLPEPFKSEFAGGRGVIMHHKFVVIDFDKPTARVYFGSYNFSSTADTKNGENLLLVRDRKIAVAYMIEGLRLFDHYHFRVKVKESKEGITQLSLAKPPRKKGEKAWWQDYYSKRMKIRDRELFS